MAFNTHGDEQQQGTPRVAPQPPPVIINNNVSAAASAAAVAGYGGYRGRGRRQSLIVHTFLLFTTAGIGNVLYWMYIRRWNRSRGLH